MPGPHPTLAVADVYRHVHERCFAPTPTPSDDIGTNPGRLVGVELEWLPASRTQAGRDPQRRQPSADQHPDHGAVRAAVTAAGALPGGTSITFEPGGQVELSSLPQRGATAACDQIAADLDVVRDALDHHEFALIGLGRDPVRPCRRVLQEPRYTAMEAYFDRDGPTGHGRARSRNRPGRIMMCSTASVQVNLDNGSEDEVGRRWRLAHTLAPTLAAVFANSPLAGGRASGWRSARLANWWQLDPSRTAPPPPAMGSTGKASTGKGSTGNGSTGKGFADAYAHYALDAQVMLFRTSSGSYEPSRQPLTMGRWVADGHELGWPTAEDLDYHLTTLFPPVRPRGWLELRVLDALPDPWWRVAVAVTAALIDDEEAADAAERAAEPAAGLWVEAARDGLAHPVLAASGRRCFEAALAALARRAADASLAEAAGRFYERFVARGRCPADEVLEAWAAHPALLALETHGKEPAWT